AVRATPAGFAAAVDGFAAGAVCAFARSTGMSTPAANTIPSATHDVFPLPMASSGLACCRTAHRGLLPAEIVRRILVDADEFAQLQIRREPVVNHRREWLRVGFRI